MNGMVERIIYMIHLVLESLLNKQLMWCPTCEEFHTLLKEVEAILNNCSLVATQDDITNLTVITPMSLLIPSLPLSHPLGRF